MQTETDTAPTLREYRRASEKWLSSHLNYSGTVGSARFGVAKKASLIAVKVLSDEWYVLFAQYA